MKVYCLFEQSGTFKNEFKKLGVDAYDFDIQNEFNETDYIVDLFAEIRGGYDGKPSIFDDLDESDLVFAFFPCTRFEDQIQTYFRGVVPTLSKWTEAEKIEYARKLHAELSENYDLISKLFLIALSRGFRLVIENPYSAQHYLKNFFPIKPAIIDKDRTENGDYMRKPTQFYFVNFEPKQTLLFEPLEEVEHRVHDKLKVQDGLSRQTLRSMMHPQYARRFIKQYIL